MTSICLSTKRVSSTVQWQNNIIFKCAFLFFALCDLAYCRRALKYLIWIHLHFQALILRCSACLFIEVPSISKWLFLCIEIVNSCKDKLPVQLCSPTHFHDQLCQETVTHGQRGQGAPQSQVDKYFCFFLQELDVWMKQSQVTAGSRAAFHGAAPGGFVSQSPSELHQLVWKLPSVLQLVLSLKLKLWSPHDMFVSPGLLVWARI